MADTLVLLDQEGLIRLLMTHDDERPLTRAFVGEELDTISDFVLTSRASTNAERLTAVGTFLREAGAPAFSREDIRAQLRGTKLPVPANFARDLAAAVTDELLEPVEGREGVYRVTAKGLSAVRNQFGRDTHGKKAS